MAPVRRYCPDNKKWSRLQEWYQSSLGRTLIAEEYSKLREVLANLFGFHLVQIGKYDTKDLLDGSRVLHRFVLGTEAVSAGGGINVVGRADGLPVASESVDVVLLAHTLEFETEPHAILREADRVLVPEGHLVILCFNPFGLWGLWRLVLGWRGRLPWCGRFLSQHRVKDWLALLGFDVLECRNLFYRPPLNQERLMARLKFMERLGNSLRPPSGAAFVLVARKRVVTLTPIRPRWRPRRSLVTPGVIRPTPRES